MTLVPARDRRRAAGVVGGGRRQMAAADYARLSVDLEAMKAVGIPFDGDCISQSLMSSAFQTPATEW